MKIFDTQWKKRNRNLETGILFCSYQSVENAGGAFFKGANERNEFFWKNKQTVMYDELVRTNKAKDELIWE